APLDVYALERVRVVARPEGVEVLERAVVHAPRAARADHRPHSGVLLRHPRHHVVERPLVVDEEVLLFAAPEPRRAGLSHVAVRVPLQIYDAGVLAPRVVPDLPDEFAHLWSV